MNNNGFTNRNNNARPSFGRYNQPRTIFNQAQEKYIIDEIIKYSGCCVGSRGASSNFLKGNGTPNNQLGQTNDMYIDLITGDIYVKTNGVWNYVINLSGSKGDKGESGPSFISGNGVPSELVGINGDTYLNLQTDDAYMKIDGVWLLQANIKGEPGEPGLKGDKGQSASIGTLAAGFSAFTFPVAIFLPGTTTIDQLVPTSLVGNYYNINNTISASGVVNITADGYWYVQQSAFLRNIVTSSSYISEITLQFLDSLNNVVYDLTNTNISNSYVGTIGDSRNLFLSTGTYHFAAIITVSGVLPLVPALYPDLFYGVHIFAEDMV